MKEQSVALVINALVILSLSACATPSDNLFLAVSQNDVPKATRLLDAGTDVKSIDRSGIPALHFALARRSERLAQLLLARGADPNQFDAAGNTALAYLSPQMEVARSSYSTGGLLDVLIQEALKPDPIFVCACELSSETIQQVLDQASNLDALDATRLTPLMRASGCGHVRTARMLLERGADPNMKNASGDTALTLASKAQAHAPMVDLLMQYGAHSRD